MSNIETKKKEKITIGKKILLVWGVAIVDG
jgi:hypothetical protein